MNSTSTPVWPAVLAIVLAAAAAGGQEPPPPPPALALEAITVTPAKPAAETLCKLRVTIRNRGEKTASALRFSVEVAGRSLPVYDKQLFMEALPPGETTEVELYNFWTSETGRPVPADGKLPVEVALEEASWVSIETGEGGEEVWTLLEPVGGLPVARTVTVSLAVTD